MADETFVCMPIYKHFINDSLHLEQHPHQQSLNLNTYNQLIECLNQYAQKRYVNALVIYYLIGVAGMAVACFGVLGNLVSAVVLTRRSMRNISTYSYLTALAACDLGFVLCFVALHVRDVQRPLPPPADPFLRDENQIREQLVFPYYFALLFPYVHAAGWTFQVGSVWLTVAFTVDRYVMICRPFRANWYCTVARARRIIAGLGLACLLCNLPKLFEYRSVEMEHHGPNNLTVNFLGVNLTHFGQNYWFRQVFHSWFYLVLVAGIPFLTIFVLNGFLVQAVHRSRQRGVQLNPTERKRSDTTVMLIGVIVIFFACQLPALVSRLLWAFSEDISDFDGLGRHALNEVANFLVLFNSSANIVPYYFFGRRFRKQFLRLFLRVRRSDDDDVYGTNTAGVRNRTCSLPRRSDTDHRLSDDSNAHRKISAFRASFER